MAKIVGYREISLDDLTIGKAQVRTQDPGKDIDELADSIAKQGLLQPIVVCEATQPGKWEILTGQRRFLAHKYLQKDKITAAVLDERVEEGEAKAISITENLIRRKLSGKELIDGITYLYNLYGTATAVREATGLPYQKVRDYVKYPRLIEPLKEMVDNGLNINVALKAQDAATEGNGEPNVEVAIKLAQEMSTMPGVQREKIAQERKSNPQKPIDEVIEDAKTGSRVIQVVATVTQNTHTALQEYAKAEGYNQNEAAAVLIKDALLVHGFLDE